MNEIEDGKMLNDLEQIKAIHSQTLAIIAQITADPKPDYKLDGQTVSWAEYLAKLRDTIDWCERKPLN